MAPDPALAERSSRKMYTDLMSLMAPLTVKTSDPDDVASLQGGELLVLAETGALKPEKATSKPEKESSAAKEESRTKDDGKTKEGSKTPAGQDLLKRGAAAAVADFQTTGMRSYLLV